MANMLFRVQRLLSHQTKRPMAVTVYPTTRHSCCVCKFLMHLQKRYQMPRITTMRISALRTRLHGSSEMPLHTSLLIQHGLLTLIVSTRPSPYMELWNSTRLTCKVSPLIGWITEAL